MKHLFTVEGLQALAEVLTRRPLLAFDFDGTLAPIVARPDDARAPACVMRSLRRLCAHRPVGIISGRSVEDLRSRLDGMSAWLVGSHGAQGLPGPQTDWRSVLDPARAQIAARIESLRSAGVDVEDKEASLALHYRLAADHGAALSMIDGVLADLGPDVRAFGGKLVVNIVPAGAPDKAHAVTSLLACTGSDCAVFLGDDVNDEPVFEAAAPDWLTVRVGPDTPGSRARFYLDSSDEVAPLLLRMTQLMGATH